MKAVSDGLPLPSRGSAAGVSSLVLAGGYLYAGGSFTFIGGQSRYSLARLSSVDGTPILCEHKVPASLCTKCHPELAAVFKSQGDWCQEHGVPESQCLQCNPNLTFGEKKAEGPPWCVEHGVPEDKCTKCHPALVARFIAQRMAANGWL